MTTDSTPSSEKILEGPDATDHSDNPNQSDGLDQSEVGLLGYGEALAELEGILVELESSMVDVDTLAKKVKRAAALVIHCRSRLSVVRADVADVVADLDQDHGDD